MRNVLSLYRLLIRVLGDLSRREVDERRDIAIAFDLERPAAGPSSSSPDGEQKSSPARFVPLDPWRAGRRRIEDEAMDARGAISVEEHAAHLELVAAERAARQVAAERPHKELLRRLATLDRIATLHMVDVAAEWSVATSRLFHTATSERKAAETISRHRRAIEGDEREARDATARYEANRFSVIARAGHAERAPLMARQAVFAQRVEEERAERSAAMLRVARLAAEAEARLDVETAEAAGRRTVLRLEATATNDTQRLMSASIARLARSKTRPSMLSVISSGVFAPADNNNNASGGDFVLTPSSRMQKSSSSVAIDSPLGAFTAPRTLRRMSSASPGAEDRSGASSAANFV